MSMITEQVKELREEADFIIETLDKQFPTTIGVAKIMKRAADTIEQLAAKVREDNAYQKAFEDIRAEINKALSAETISDNNQQISDVGIGLELALSIIGHHIKEYTE